MKNINEYESAKNFGLIALVLSMVNMTYTFATVTLAVGLGVGLTQGSTLDPCSDGKD